MNWRPLLFLPIAAYCLGDPATAPALREKIPEISPAGCNYAHARENYLRAYAYQRDHATERFEYCRRARAALTGCEAEAALLAVRIQALCDLPVAK